MRPILIALATTSALVAPALSEEDFGKFTAELVGQFAIVDGETRFITKAPFGFVDPNSLSWEVPPEVITDGASIPSFFWWLVGHPIGGSYLWAAVVHDYYCEQKARTAEATHRTFYYGMRALAVEPWKADLMYWAVATFGPQWTLEKRIEQQQDCKIVDGQVICNVVPVTKEVAVPAPSVDLSNPEILALAQDKFAAVARTLKTSDGRVLDVSPFGEILSGVNQIEQSAAAYRDVFVTGAFRNNPGSLGVMTDAWRQTTTIESIPAWPDSKLPSYTDSPSWSDYVLRPEALESTAGSYVLQPGESQSLTDLFLSQDVNELQQLDFTTLAPNQTVLVPAN